MLEIARQRAVTYLRELQDIIEFKESDIDSLSLSLSPLTFDAVLCRWRLMFLSNLDDTLTGIFNTLKKRGRLAAVVWSIQSKVPTIGFPMSIVTGEMNFSNPSVCPSTDNLKVPGPFFLANERILKDSLQKAGFKDIQIEIQNVTFEFASVNDYIKHLKGVAAPLKALLDKEFAGKQEEIWEMVAREVKDNFTNQETDDSIKMDNECICFVGTK